MTGLPKASQPSAPPPAGSLRVDPTRFNSSTFSPVSESGFFEFDKVIKAGHVLKRTKRTKSWKSVHLVLRSNALSVYKDEQETQLRHQVSMSEINAVASRKDRKRKGDHEGVFGLFIPSRTFHFEADSKEEAREWVELIRREARMDEKDENMVVTSSSGAQKGYTGFGRIGRPPPGSAGRSSRDRESSSSPDPHIHIQPATRAVPRPIPKRRTSQHQDYSGNEQGSFSDFSDTPGFISARDFSSLSTRHKHDAYASGIITTPGFYDSDNQVGQNASTASGLDTKDDARVIWHGWLQCLKSRSGVRQWKRYWVVQRTQNLALYKNEEEYCAALILPMSSIMDAVETDSISKSKNFCMQIILEDRTYRFCAANEEDLSTCLGSLKSILARRKGSSKPV